ncbi:hypothetical protein ABPG74_017744 [Tetrahymena malaccensis]
MDLSFEQPELDYSILDLRKKYNVEILKQDASLIPYCSEKLSVEILILSIQQLNSNVFHISDQSQSQIINLLQEMQNRLKIEDQINPEIQQLIQNLTFSINQKPEQFVLDAEKLLKKIRPLNINEMKRLINEANQVSFLIKGEEIILFLGNTGAGKSTTVHFLAGSRMVELKKEVENGSFLSYIGPDPSKIQNKALQNVRIGTQAESETRYITPVKVNYSDIQMIQNGYFILCDVPGFGDTAGPEVDIANGIAIVEAIKQCKSVRPVILLSYKSVGDKGQGIKDMARLLVGFVQNPLDNLSQFTYLFTKFPDNVNIGSELINIKQSIDQSGEQSSDKSFNNIFQDMIEQSKGGRCKVEPLTNQPQTLLKQIMNKEGVLDPSQIFKFSITQSSQSVIKDQALKSQQMIISAVNRCEYDLINYQLNQLKFLADILNLNSTKQTYEQCKKLVIDYFNNYYNKAIEQLNQFISNENKLDVQFLQQFQELINKSKSLEQLRNQHLGSEVMQYDSLMQQLKLSVQKMSNVFNQEGNITKFASNNIDNIKLISEYFPELKYQYNEACEKIMKKIENCVISCQKFIKEKNFDQLKKFLYQIKHYHSEFKNHLNEQLVINEQNQLKKQFYDIFVDINEKTNQILERKKLQQEDIDILNQYFQDFRNVEKDLDLTQHIQIDQIQKQKRNFTNSLLKYFEKINKQIEDTLKLDPEEAFKKLECFVKQMKEFRQIKGIDYLTFEKYYKSIQDVESLMQSIKRQVEQYLNDFKHDKKKVDFQKVHRCLNQLKSAEWMNDVTHGIYQQQIKCITDELIKYLQFEIINKMGDLDLNCKNYQNITLASEYLTEMDRIKVFGEFDIKLKELCELAEQNFKNSIKIVFDQIKDLISQYIEDQDSQNGYALRESRIFNSIQIGCQTKLKSRQDFIQIKVDMGQTEDFLIYLKACSKNKWIRPEASFLQEKLKQILVQYGVLIKDKIQEYFQIITQVNEKCENQRSIDSQKLAELSQELIELQNYKITCDIVQGSQILQEFKNKMQQFYLELYDDLNQTSLDYQIQAQKIRIAKLLSLSENILGNQKFYNLYKDQQIEKNNELKGIYQKIIEQIEIHQFQKASFDLSQIDDKSVNEKAMKQIKITLVTSIGVLLEKAQDKKYQIGNQIQNNYVKEIVQIIEQIRKAKQFLSDYFNKEFLDEVDRQIDQIILDIQNKIDEYLESMSAHVKQSDFFQVEEKREHIMQILQLLNRYNSSTNVEINKKLAQLQKELEDKVKQITEVDYNDENNLISYPPKNILEKLSKVTGRNTQYVECYDRLNKQLIDGVSNSIVDYQNSTQQEQNQKELKVQALINSLPNDLKIQYQDQFNSVKQFKAQKFNVFENDFQQAIKNGELDKLKYIQLCNQEKMIYFLDKMSIQIQQESQKYLFQFQECLNCNKIQESIQQAIKLLEQKNTFLEYKKKFQENNDKTIQFEKLYREIENVITSNYSNVQQTIQQEIKINLDNLQVIKTIEDSDQYQNEYERLQTLIINLKNFEKYFLNPQLIQQLQLSSNQIYSFLMDIFKTFYENLKLKQMKRIKQDLLQINKWDNFIQKIINDSKKKNLFSELFLKSFMVIEFKETCLSWKDCTDKVVNQIVDIKQNVLNFCFQAEPLLMVSYYIQLKSYINYLIDLKEVNINFGSTKIDNECYEKECVPQIKSKIEDFEKEVENFFFNQEKQFTEKEFKIFNNYYENLIKFNELAKNQNIDIEHYKKRIGQKLEQKIEYLENSIDSNQIGSVTKNLILIKTYSVNIPQFKKSFDSRIDNWLKNVYLLNCKGKKIAQLATHLLGDKTNIGMKIIEEHEIFKQQSISIFNKKAQEHGIDYVLDNIKGEDLDKTKLQNFYYKFLLEYKEIVQKNIISIENMSQTQQNLIDSMVSSIKMKSKIVKLKDNEIRWDNSVRQNIPSLMAHIFALWTLLNMEQLNELNDLDKEEKEIYLFQPHAGQAISIFRLLGLGYKEDGLQNNFIQIGTGEGKSIVLAITAIILALHSVDVYCACYSQYLSQRDYQNFIKLFDILGVSEYIRYAAFTKICEYIINEQGDVRQLTIDFIKNGFSNDKKMKIENTRNPRILLVDEADVFFSKEFHGNIYNPIARLQDENIEKIAELIWQSRKKQLPLKQVQQTQQYQEIIKKFKNFSKIIDECIKDLISDSKNFSHNYIVQNDRIAYYEQDGVSFDITYGYKTLFAYFQEKENGTISEKSLKENIFLLLKCGSFSYSEIPFQFEKIIGVTGTLETLSEIEKTIVQNTYKITKNTYIPSVFGQNNRKFAIKDDTYVENEKNYHKILRDRIEKSLVRNSQQRAILVFFENEQKLQKFFNSPELSDLKHCVNVITENTSNLVNEEIKNQLIKKATVSGQITLLTAQFGRGTDFKCCDQQVLNNGGVHVIQAFFSTKKSEEIQIMGRCARQGAEGSFNLVLLDSDLEKILGADYRKAIDEMRQNNNFYQVLDKKRNEIEYLEHSNNKKLIEYVKQKHIDCQGFINSLASCNENQVLEFLLKNNKGSNDIQDQIRILCLVDGTSSMGPLLNKTKNEISVMLERTRKIIRLSNKNIPEDCFQIQFAVYRDYDQMSEGILQVSPWESKADNLRQFLDQINPVGGEDYEEAIEIGLQYANNENQNYPLSAIILIADAPAKSISQIKEYRERYGGENYWKQTKFSQITNYKEQIQKIKSVNIPIHCFYLHDEAKKNFTEIASLTEGKCERLDINSTSASQKLIQIVVEPILVNVGKQNQLGDSLYQEYLKMFDKNYK